MSEFLEQHRDIQRARERAVMEGLERTSSESVMRNAREILPRRLLDKLDTIPDLNRERQRRLAEMLRDAK